jgi:hypothetical protein
MNVDREIGGECLIFLVDHHRPCVPGITEKTRELQVIPLPELNNGQQVIMAAPWIFWRMDSQKTLPILAPILFRDVLKHCRIDLWWS